MVDIFNLDRYHEQFIRRTSGLPGAVYGVRLNLNVKQVEERFLFIDIL